MASEETVVLNAEHRPHPNALEAFHHVQHDIRAAILKSRRDWDKHEPRMWARAATLSDEQLIGFSLAEDLVAVRSGPTSYGQIVLGKIRIPAVDDELGAGYIHVRIHDPPNRGTDDVKFHSLFTDEHRETRDGPPTAWQAIQTEATPLVFFNE
ncbi:hypothetical protein BC834DRAFT_646153 [Gloeopeniophorella convolvens]|nr:hypothetical protein BC834DRAFT_646153 [Gloeopeniophorella convolvens]